MSSPNFRVIAHVKHGGSQVTQGGAVLKLATGSFYDIGYEALASQVASVLVVGIVGTTANRPVTASNGQFYVDTTLSKIVFADGVGNWYDPFTGGTV